MINSRESGSAHNRRNRRLLGRRFHAGMTFDGRRAIEPFVGADIQLNDEAVFQADWIAGQGNAVSAGLVYVFPDQRTVVNPAILFSNDRKRLDGLFVNLSHQFNL